MLVGPYLMTAAAVRHDYINAHSLFPILLHVCDIFMLSHRSVFDFLARKNIPLTMKYVALSSDTMSYVKFMTIHIHTIIHHGRFFFNADSP